MSLLIEALNRAEQANRDRADTEENVLPFSLDEAAPRPAQTETSLLTHNNESASLRKPEAVPVLTATPTASETSIPPAKANKEAARSLMRGKSRRSSKSIPVVAAIAVIILVSALGAGLMYLEQQAVAQFNATNARIATTLQIEESVPIADDPPADFPSNSAILSSEPLDTLTFSPDPLNTILLPPAELLASETMAPELLMSEPVFAEPVFAETPVTDPAIAAPVLAESSTQNNSNPAPTSAVTRQVTDITIRRTSIDPFTMMQLEQATQLIRARQFAQAVPLLDSILARQPDNLQALLLAGSSYLNLDDRPTAAALFGRILSINPAHVEARAAYMQALPGRSTADQILELNRLRQSAPDNARLAFDLGLLHASAQQWHQAAQAFNDALRVAQQNAAGSHINPDYAFNLAVALDRIGNKDLAARHYRDALVHAQFHPPGFDTELVRARIQSITGR
jgi:tetratricopeptide (TPR) repeat protein